MVDISDEFFYKNVTDTSSDDESDDDLLMEAALPIHEHNVARIPVYRGPCRVLHTTSIMKILKKTMPRPFISFYILFEQVLCHLIGGE
jgi:hypothetical protein